MTSFFPTQESIQLSEICENIFSRKNVQSNLKGKGNRIFKTPIILFLFSVELQYHPFTQGLQGHLSLNADLDLERKSNGVSHSTVTLQFSTKPDVNLICWAHFVPSPRKTETSLPPLRYQDNVFQLWSYAMNKGMTEERMGKK